MGPDSFIWWDWVGRHTHEIWLATLEHLRLTLLARRASTPPVARHAPTDQNTGPRPTDVPSAPKTRGTATDIELMSDMRTPAASPMRPGGVCVWRSAMTIGCPLPRPRPRQNDSARSAGAVCANGNRR